MERDEEHDKARREHQLEARREFGKHDLLRRALIDVGITEIATRGVAEIAAELDGPWCIEPKLVTKRRALGFGHGLSHDLAQRIAEGRPHREGDDRDDEHHHKRLTGTP